jgi:gliding motility-associated-like protein
MISFKLAIAFMGLITITVNNAKAQAPIYPSIPGTTQIIGQEFVIEIQAGTDGDTVDNLFGVTFHVAYNPSQNLSFVEATAGDFLDGDVVFFSRVEAPGRVVIAITRKAGAGGVSGKGVVARVRFVSSTNTPDCTPAQFAVESVIAIDSDGKPVPLTPDTLSVIIVPELDFTVRAVPETLHVIPGAIDSFRVSLSANCAFDTVAVLSAIPPSSVKQYQFTPTSIDTLTTSVLRVEIDPFAVAGIDRLIIHASAKGLMSADTVFVQIKPPQPDVWPNPFTPNNDGYNDFVTFDFPVNNEPLTIEIYNFRGRKIAELKGKNRWYGKSDSGEDLQPGLYLYLVKIDGAIKVRGTITLAR